jgi:hypothetical protein
MRLHGPSPRQPTLCSVSGVETSYSVIQHAVYTIEQSRLDDDEDLLPYTLLTSDDPAPAGDVAIACPSSILLSERKDLS